MGILIVFLLAVLFVAAVWGREAAQKLFKGGMKVAGILFLLGAVGVILLAINIQPPSQTAIQTDLSTASQSAYHVPLDSRNSSDPGAPLRRPVEVQSSSSNSGNASNIAVDDYLSGRNTAPPSPVNNQFVPASNTAIRPTAAPLRAGKPHFGFGYYPQNGFIVVSQVYPGSPAAEAGIVPGMGILAVNGRDVHQLEDVWNAQHRIYRIGDVVTFTVGAADGKSYNIPIRLGSDAEPWGANVQR